MFNYHTIFRNKRVGTNFLKRDKALQRTIIFHLGKVGSNPFQSPLFSV